MGTSCNVDPDAVFVVGDALVDVGRRLRNEFETALEVARQAEAKPCA
ncbi:MAG: hypothetical protein Q7T93_04370 [Methylobacterium sp.]|nr:hypothetical protein [Methylobacterium sp.]MDO9426045.1 hypothetical protein [Methylobacterium sp.]